MNDRRHREAPRELACGLGGRGAVEQVDLDAVQLRVRDRAWPTRERHDLDAVGEELLADRQADAGAAAGDRSDACASAVAAHAASSTSASTRSGLPLPFSIFSGGQTSTAPVGRQQVEVGEALQAVAASAVHVVVARVRRPQVEALPGVGADRLRAEAEHVALLDQEAHRLRARPRRVLAFLVEVLVRLGIAPLRPVGAHQEPGAFGDAAVRGLEALDVLDREQVVGVSPALARCSR